MKTNNKINAYILRVSTSALLFSCVIVALCLAIRLPEQGPKALRQYNRPEGTLNDGKFLIWSVNSIGGAGSAARQRLDGNPGARLRISTSASFGTDTVTAIKDDFTTTIPFEGDTFTFSVDFLSGPGASGDGQALLLLVRQGNDIYGLPLGVTGVKASWSTLVFNGTFNQAAFSHILGPGAATPDFTSGVPTHFGFAGQNSFSSTTSYYDNFHLVSDAVSVCVPPPPDMVSWWPGDGNTDDIIDGNSGAFVGNATYAAGEVGQAFSFDGSNYVEVPDAANLDFEPNAPITVDMWVYRTGTATIMHCIGKRVGCTGSGSNYQISLNTDTGKGLAFGGDNGGAVTGQDLPLNTWTHLAGTFDGSTFRFYINGTLAGTGTGTLGPTNNEPLRIGKSGDCANFVGLIDEVELFNRALSQPEIQSIVDAGSAGKCRPEGTPTPTPTASPTPTCAPPAPNLVSWWPGDDDAVDIIDGNDGILQNGATFATGLVDQAFLLDGIDDFVDVGNAPNLHVSQGEFTVDAWVNFNALFGDMSILDKMISGGNFNTDGWRLLKQVDNRFWFCFGGGGDNGCGDGFPTTVISTTTASTGTWFHIAAVKSAAEIAIYVNGVNEASKPTPAFTDTNSTNLLMARTMVLMSDISMA
jgi:hypothetical protein